MGGRIQKGEVRNPRGRGSAKGKVPTAVKDCLEQLLRNNIERAQEDIDALAPKDRITVLLKLAEMVVPKAQEISLSDSSADSDKTALLEAMSYDLHVTRKSKKKQG